MRFKAIFDNPNIGIAFSRMDEKEVLINSALMKMLGLASSKTTLQELVKMSHPEDNKKELPLFEEVYSGKKNSYSMDKRYVVKGKKIVWGRIFFSITRDDSGVPKFSLAFVENITKEKEEAEDLNKFNKLTINREIKMVELKKKIKDLEGKIKK